MLRKAACVLLVAALAAQPAAAQPSGGNGGGGGSLWQELHSLHTLYEQYHRWVQRQLSDAIDKVREKVAPITDTLHAASQIVRWLQNLSGGLPDLLSGLQLFARVISRFQGAPDPPSGSVADAAREIIQQAPSSELAQRVRAHDETSAASDSSVSGARAAQEAVERTVDRVVLDLTMEQNLEVARQAAQELASRAAHTPSTRAAVQLLIEGFAAFMEQQAAQNADISARINGLVQVQASLSKQLTAVTEQAAMLVEQMVQKHKHEAEQEAVATRMTVVSAIGGVGAAASAIASVAPDPERRSQQDQMYQRITSLYGER